jgi:hypothetical protein
MRFTTWMAAGFVGAIGWLSPLQAKPVVTFTSECSCEGNHGVSRWVAKTDLSQPPSNLADIQPITPAEIYEWQGPGVKITHSSPRIAAEEKWYAVTGRISKVRIEDDGDLHIVMNNADGKAGSIIIELPLGPPWCEMRKMVFSWTNARFPFVVGQKDAFRLLQHPVVTVIGKAFYDIDHSGRDTQSNQRSYDQALAVWEIHPVMQLSIGGSRVGHAPPPTTATQTPIPPTSTPEQFVTIMEPVTIKIPYGQTVLPRGMKLPVVSHDASTVYVRYMNEIYPIPLSSTDFGR